MTYKHEIKVRVYYQDTDAYGIVYHANYLSFAERGRAEYSRSRGKSIITTLLSMNLAIVARHVEVDYFFSARVDDELRIVTWVSKINNSSYTMQSDIHIEDKLICTVKATLVNINEKWRPVRIPNEIKELLN